MVHNLFHSLQEAEDDSLVLALVDSGPSSLLVVGDLGDQGGPLGEFVVVWWDSLSHD